MAHLLDNLWWFSDENCWFSIANGWRTIEKVWNSPSWMGGEKILEELKVNIPKVDCAPNRLTRNFEKKRDHHFSSYPQTQTPVFLFSRACDIRNKYLHISPWFSSLNFSGIQAACTGKTCAFLLPIISSLDTAQARSSMNRTIAMSKCGTSFSWPCRCWIFVVSEISKSHEKTKYQPWFFLPDRPLTISKDIKIIIIICHQIIVI